MTVTVTVVVSTRPAPEPVTVMGWAPSGKVLLIVIVMVEVPEPGAGMGLGLKVTVLEPPDRLIAESKPPATFEVMVNVPELPLATVMAFGKAEIEKLFFVALTVRVTVVAFVTPPPVPVTVMVYVPFAVVVSTVSVKVEVPEPGAAIDAGLKVAVTPAGWPVADKATAESKPFKAAVAIFEVPLLPCATETEVGEAEIVKLAEAVPARASMRAAPFGLPQPVDKS